MTEQEVLLPTEAARRLGVANRVVVQAMYERRLSASRSIRAGLCGAVAPRTDRAPKDPTVALLPAHGQHRSSRLQRPLSPDSTTGSG